MWSCFASAMMAMTMENAPLTEYARQLAWWDRQVNAPPDPLLREARRQVRLALLVDAITTRLEPAEVHELVDRLVERMDLLAW